ncbi:MAG: hypothetical protein ACUZ8I_07145 [Candidatus Scalindua sp.]
MNYRLLWHFLLTGFFILIVSSTTFGQINHDLKITLHPDSYRLEVVDKITLSQASTKTEPLFFTLHQGLKPEILDKDTILRENFGAEAARFFGNNPSLQHSNIKMELFEVIRNRVTLICDQAQTFGVLITDQGDPLPIHKYRISVYWWGHSLISLPLAYDCLFRNSVVCLLLNHLSILT